MSELFRLISERRRLVNLLAAVVCGLLIGYALYEQHVKGLDPCPLCMFQRVGIITIGLVFLLAAVHGPKSTTGSRVYGFLIALATAGTAAIAIRHLWIQSQPAGSVPACGAPLDTMMQMFPMTEVIARVLKGGGECAKIDWTFLGLSMPGWVLIAVAGLALLGLLANVPRVRRELVMRTSRR